MFYSYISDTTSSSSVRNRSLPVPPDALCWICYGTEDESVHGHDWVYPCRCCGSGRWVHQSCLQKWIDEKQQNDINASVSCHACGHVYKIIYPVPGSSLILLEAADQLFQMSSYYFFGGLLVGSVYWSAVTYGAITVMQVYGAQEALDVMERADPILLLMGLPAIPTLLILSKLIRWQDGVLNIWRKHIRPLPFLRPLLPKDIPDWRLTEVGSSSLTLDIASVPRIILSALSLPTFAILCGRLFFRHIESELLQAVFGGCTFIGVKGLLEIYHRELKFFRFCRRKIRNYESD